MLDKMPLSEFPMYLRAGFTILFLWAVRALYIRWKLPKGAKWLPGPPGMS